MYVFVQVMSIVTLIGLVSMFFVAQNFQVKHLRAQTTFLKIATLSGNIKKEDYEIYHKWKKLQRSYRIFRKIYQVFAYAFLLFVSNYFILESVLKGG
ncbi:hypothetical protein AVT69_gp069 [Pseudomonas phage PhiPA3]|uniref:Uncharacterized protein 070 n=1 Tax=Pseudomonas phage PhiPA3 TaxID=998086 RepID=F8SJU9_BPPA3|nr:hypothetical protein AVT69_gp069 [Pseudomonas phage PhiPA3]AEH03494.1 hypothetical protein [Pseudomonas phage PhiPA3]